jgi:hypothetical protein
MQTHDSTNQDDSQSNPTENTNAGLPSQHCPFFRAFALHEEEQEETRKIIEPMGTGEMRMEEVLNGAPEDPTTHATQKPNPVNAYPKG